MPSPGRGVVRIVVVDDHPLFRRGVIDLLAVNPEYLVVGEASSAEETPALVHRTKPDLVLLDVRLGRVSGLSVVPALRSTCPDVRIIVLTMFVAPEFQRAARAAGAHGYVTKRDADSVLPSAIRAVLHGGEHYPDVDPPAPGPDDLPLLAAREAEVVRGVARGYTNRKIADRMSISIKSVESYRARSMHKLGLSTRADLVRYALEVGLLGGDPSPADE